MNTISTIVIKPARQNPLAFVALAVALFALLIVARMMQNPTVAAAAITPAPATAVPDADSMTSDFFFVSEFADNDPLNSSWDQSAAGELTRMISGGQYVIANGETGRATASLFDPQHQYHNATITMTAKLDETSAPAAGYGIVFRYQDASNYNVFGIDGMGRFSIWVREAGQWRELRGLDGENWTENAAILPLSEMNTLRLSIYDDSLTGFVNGKQVVSLTEATFDSGAVGIYMATPSEGGASLSVESYQVAMGAPITESMTGDADSMTGDSVDSMTGDSTEEADQ